MPCLAGFIPVVHDTHAGNVTGGIVESNLPKDPSSMNVARFGSSPFLISKLMISNVPPSIPITTTLLSMDHFLLKYKFSN